MSVIEQLHRQKNGHNNLAFITPLFAIILYKNNFFISLNLTIQYPEWFQEDRLNIFFKQKSEKCLDF